MAACFFKIAADLAGIEVSKPMLEVTQKQVVAEIVQHAQNLESEPKAERKLEEAAKKDKPCAIF